MDGRHKRVVQGEFRGDKVILKWGKYPQLERVTPNYELISTRNQVLYMIKSIIPVITIKQEGIINV
jgi:hypothetical protein